MPLTNPQMISQDLLDRTGAACLSGDTDACVACFAVPHRVTTCKAVEGVAGKSELRDVFHAMRRYFLSCAVMDILRPCSRGRFVDNDTVQRRCLAGNRLLRRPTMGLSTIRRFGDIWRNLEGHYATQDAPAHLAALMQFRRMSPSFTPDAKASAD